MHCADIYCSMSNGVGFRWFVFWAFMGLIVLKVLAGGMLAGWMGAEAKKGVDDNCTSVSGMACGMDEKDLQSGSSDFQSDEPASIG